MISALQAGFDRAFATIIDSNSTMAIAALILFGLATLLAEDQGYIRIGAAETDTPAALALATAPRAPPEPRAWT